MPDDRPRHVAEGRTCRAPNWLRYAYFARAAAALAASAANSSRPNAVPESPQPPSAASVRITQVRLACVGSPETLVTISVISLTSCFWPARFNAAGGVMTWTRTVRAELVAAVCTACGSMRWMKAAVLFKWKGPGVAKIGRAHV